MTEAQPDARPPARIDAQAIVQRYPMHGGGEVTVLNGVDLSLAGKGINVLLGPSGCGKSTLMRLFGGFRPEGAVTPTSGTIGVYRFGADGSYPSAAVDYVAGTVPLSTP